MDLTNLNSAAILSINQYQDPLYNWIWRTNPYISMFSRREFVAQDGLTPRVITTTGELPTAYPSDLPGITISDGTGNSCDVEATTVNSGQIERDYTLQAAAIETNVFCLTDFQFGWEAAQTVSNLQANLGQYVTVLWSDLYRWNTLGLVDTKVSTLSGGEVDTDENSDFGFGAVSTPNEALSWDHLTPLYDELVRLGGALHAVGWSEGNPLFALCVGPGQKRALFQTDSKIRDTVNWQTGEAALQNFEARGINTSINGFIPNVDDFMIRYDAGMNPLYPTVNTNATKGRKFIKNPAYRTVAKGGSAVYEAFYILCRDIYEVRPRSIGPTQFGMASFNPINYVGDLRWINNPDMDKNKLGNKGLFRADIQVGFRPVRPEIGYVGLTLAVDK